MDSLRSELITVRSYLREVQMNAYSGAITRALSRIAELEARELGWIQTLSTMQEERDRLREALERINDASNHYAMTPTYSEGTLRYAHKTTRNLARAALLREE